MPDYQTIPPGPVLGVKVFIFNQHHKLLVLTRSKEGTRPGGPDVVGGLVEFGEDPEQAAWRETREETGIELESLKLFEAFNTFEKLDDGRDKHTVIMGYTSQVTSDKIKLSSEHTEYQWLTLKQVSRLEFPPEHRHFVKKLVA